MELSNFRENLEGWTINFGKVYYSFNELCNLSMALKRFLNKALVAINPVSERTTQ